MIPLDHLKRVIDFLHARREQGLWGAQTEFWTRRLIVLELQYFRRVDAELRSS